MTLLPKTLPRMAKTQKIHLVGQKNNYLLNKLLTYKYYNYFINTKDIILFFLLIKVY